VCRDLNAELRKLNLEVTGSIKEAEMHRLVHTTMRDAVRTAYAAYCAAPSGNDRAEYRAWNAADRAWEEHVADHKVQAAERRAERVK
jgi:hypothetical protein